MNPKYLPLLCGGLVALAVVPALGVAFYNLDTLERAVWTRLGVYLGLSAFAIWGVVRLWIGACFNYKKEETLLEARLDLQYLDRKARLNRVEAKDNRELALSRNGVEDA
jgi:hypothetical protein